ncbi:type I-C CRISPR-associated protein Cas8c/Csd1 [Streptomyces avicenniae]|uniref:type I-C CRISPR-associated protein Cas8c/Csd1 n=1 Tax=Streptomyces avicenniae TaxID=500153 RepID=UPI000A739F00|nr:type I-C CRISPR-associated protein Cas8c/Csd1 [Streptomyces avicenniae]
MLLQRLTEYADRIADTLPPEFFRDRQIHWGLVLTDDGRHGSLIDLRPAKKAKGGGVVQPVPYVQRSGTKVAPFLLVDTAEFVLGRPRGVDAPGGPTDKDRAEAARRHRDYRALVVRWTNAASEDGCAKALATFLDGEGVAALDVPEDLDARETVAVMVDSQWLHELPAVRRLWSTIVRERKGGAAGASALCLVCGKVGSLLATIPEPVKKGLIPSTGGSNEAQLVSVNTEAQGRNGSIQLVNTPVCDRCGGRTMAALNHLLADERHRRRFPDSVLVWWTRHHHEQPLIETLDDNPPDPEIVRHLIEVLNEHPTPDSLRGLNESDFCSLTLGLNNARTVVRDWLDIPLVVLKANLGAWYEDHGVFDGWSGTTRYVPLWLMALATGRHSGGQYVKGSAPQGVERDLFTCALRRTPLPAHLLPHLLQRIRADGHLDAPRVALLRLALSRPHDRTDRPMPRLDPDSTDPAYLCGRAFAVLEAVQRAALPDVKATLGDKYFGAAMTAPGTVLANLRHGANAHFKRLRRDNEGAYWALRNRLTTVFAAFSDDLPAHLSLRGQGRFVIGYEQQRAADLAAAKAAKDAKTAKNGAAPDSAAPPVS